MNTIQQQREEDEALSYAEEDAYNQIDGVRDELEQARTILTELVARSASTIGDYRIHRQAREFLAARPDEDAIPGALTPCHSCNGARTEPDDCGQCPACRVALKDAAYALAMHLLQSDAYANDPDVERNVDTVLHITLGVPSKNRVIAP